MRTYLRYISFQASPALCCCAQASRTAWGADVVQVHLHQFWRERQFDRQKLEPARDGLGRTDACAQRQHHTLLSSRGKRLTHSSVIGAAGIYQARARHGPFTARIAGAATHLQFEQAGSGLLLCYVQPCVVGKAPRRKQVCKGLPRSRVGRW